MIQIIITLEEKLDGHLRVAYERTSATTKPTKLEAVAGNLLIEAIKNFKFPGVDKISEVDIIFDNPRT